MAQTPQQVGILLLHKLREAKAEELRGRVIGGEGKVAEVDAGYFGGYAKPANLAANRIDRHYTFNQSGKRKAVIVIRERDGTRSPPCSAPRARRCHGYARALPRERLSTRTSHRIGTSCIAASK